MGFIKIIIDTNSKGIKSLEIINGSGKTSIFIEHFVENDVDVDALPNGLYMVKVVFENLITVLDLMS